MFYWCLEFREDEVAAELLFQCSTQLALYQEEPVNAEGMLLQLPFGALTHLCVDVAVTGWVEAILTVFPLM